MKFFRPQLPKVESVPSTEWTDTQTDRRTDRQTRRSPLSPCFAKALWLITNVCYNFHQINPPPLKISCSSSKNRRGFLFYLSFVLKYYLHHPLCFIMQVTFYFYAAMFLDISHNLGKTYFFVRWHFYFDLSWLAAKKQIINVTAEARQSITLYVHCRR